MKASDAGNTDAWDMIIANVTSQLREVAALASRLKISLDYFEKRRAQGAPYPGEEKLKEAGLI